MNRWESAKDNSHPAILSKPRHLATLVHVLVPEFDDYSVCMKILRFISSELMDNSR